MCGTIMAQASQDTLASLEEGTVFSLDNVPLDLPIAGVGSRLLAGLLDYLIVGALGILWLTLSIVAASAAATASRGAGLAVAGVAILGLFLIEYGYFSGFEIATSGQTPGKMALGLTVVTRQGARPPWGVLLARNLVRTIDLLVGVPLMVVDLAARRLGDRLAGTLVVYHDQPETEATLARVPQGWGAAEVALFEAFLRREIEMDRGRARLCASQLVSAIRRDDPGYLEGLANAGDPVALLRRAAQTERA
jgi:uncharacterized RDD family membrane protein YckC